ncbi:MAG: DUF5309 domain-containing protein [Muribaculaceae bacterium]|nr:DUF5309 domain-containing protein [Muribaculaceae bacterium]
MSENPNIVAGSNGGQHIGGAPATTENIAQAAPGLLRNSIDRRIVKVRPMSTPIDQLTRCAAGRKATAMTVEYYSVDTKLTETTLAADTAGTPGIDRGDGMKSYVIKTAADNIFDPSETILVPEVDGADAGSPLVLYVLGRPQDGGVEVVPLNGTQVSGMGGSYVALPAIAKGARLVRMGRAATELDVQTAQFAAMPRKAANNCQIFKMQVEQSTLAKIAGKEVGWSFSDQEEAAIIDMRLGMEKSFLFGHRSVIVDPNKNENVYFTGGIWNQAARTVELDLDTLTEADLVSLCSSAFTGNNGSKRKILIAGTALMEALSKLQYSKVVSAGETRVKWGIEFKELVSNFGSLYVLHSEVFDQCGHAADGFVLDPNYLTKYVHVPFRAEKLDLRASGQRNTDAVVLTEASCLVLRYPNAHIRVVGKQA